MITLLRRTFFGSGDVTSSSDLVLLQEAGGEGPGSVRQHLVYVPAVPQGFVTLVLRHHCVAFKFVCEFIAAD